MLRGGALVRDGQGNNVVELAPQRHDRRARPLALALQRSGFRVQGSGFRVQGSGWGYSN